jgi:nucleoside-diphosphate-sugar epimerase
MVAAVRRAAGRPDLPYQPAPWALLTALSPIVPRSSLRLDNRRLLAAIGREPHTPLDEAVA